MPASRMFAFACAFELGLGGIAVLFAQLLGLPFHSWITWRLRDVIWGMTASLPLLLVLWWALNSPRPEFARIRFLLDQTVRPLFGKCSIAQLALISILAGFGEELLFRGLIQGGLAEAWSPLAGLLVAGLCFGFAHAITWTYVVLATLIGLYLGWLWMLTGNLLAPLITHAVYDLVALIYFLRIRPANEPEPLH
jgi:uncharacterized protein